MKSIATLILCLLTTFAVSSEKLLYDRFFSPYSGAMDLLLAEKLILNAEDALFDGSGRNSTGKVWGRAAEQFLFWYNLNMMAAVTQHEVFGHGYRLRELHNNPSKYWVTPWGGATYFNLPHSFSVGEMLAVDVAGLEAEAILARDLKMKWISQKKIDGRQSSLYTQTAQSLFWYTLITQLGKLKNEQAFSGNDIESYITLHNALYPKERLSSGKLTRWALFNWLDPMTFFAYYAFFYYIAEGKSFNLPMFTIGDEVFYLPNIRIGYAPYSPEAYLENFFSIQGKPLYFYLKGSSNSFGLGINYDQLFVWKKGTLGFRFDGWNQRAFLSNATVWQFIEGENVSSPSLNKRTWGAALSLKGSLNLSPRVAIYTEIGGKTSGYLPGYRLDKEIIGRIGLMFGNNSLAEKPNLM